jgi:hypothetical protein
MKNLSYLIILLFAITLSSCGDINEFTPTVQAPNAEWKMSFVNTIAGSPTTTSQSVPEKFDPKFDYTNKTLTINHVFHDDTRAWFGNAADVKVVPTVTGPQIEITYTQITDVTNSLPNQVSAFPWTHTFTFAEIGRGTTARIPVVIRRTYRNTSLFGFDKVDNVRYITP